MRVLTEFRTNKQGNYAPSPVAAGMALIWIGLGLIAGYLYRAPKRIFYTVQAALVWQWMDQRNYTRAMARMAWLLTALCNLGLIAFALIYKAIFL